MLLLGQHFFAFNRLTLLASLAGRSPLAGRGPEERGRLDCFPARRRFSLRCRSTAPVPCPRPGAAEGVRLLIRLDGQRCRVGAVERLKCYSPGRPPPHLLRDPLESVGRTRRRAALRPRPGPMWQAPSENLLDGTKYRGGKLRARKNAILLVGACWNTVRHSSSVQDCPCWLVETSLLLGRRSGTAG